LFLPWRSMLNRNNKARQDRKQDRLDSGFMSRHFPNVASIIISMIYTQRGARSILRTLNFYPGSYAFFRVDCLSDNCMEGGFDLSQIITSMIRNHSETAKGELNCGSDNLAADHSNIVYEVAIQYT